MQAAARAADGPALLAAGPDVGELDLDRRAPLAAEDELEVVLGVAAAEVAAGLGPDLVGEDVAEERDGVVDDVRAVVVEVAAGHRARGLPVPAAAEAVPAEADAEDLADETGLADLLHLEEVLLEVALLERDEHAAALLRGGGHRVHVRDREAERLLAEHVLAGAERHFGVFCVCRVVGRDDDEVEVRVGDQALRVRVGAAAELGRGLRDSLRDEVGDGGYRVERRRGAEEGGMDAPAAAAEAGDADANRFFVLHGYWIGIVDGRRVSIAGPDGRRAPPGPGGGYPTERPGR